MISTPAGSSTDYASLREEGIRHLERVAGDLWTDFNTHDPGITILEQLCYAITDLGYRASYDLPDLLAEGGADSSAGLFSAARILTSAPVTLADKRRLILDVTGAKNAWIEPVAEPQPLLSHEPGAKEVWIGPPRAASEPIWLRGLYRVQIEKSDFVDIDGSILRREAAQRFLGRRALGEDLDVVRILAPQDVELHAHVEIAPTEDPEGVAAKIFAAVQHYLSPHVEFRTLAEMRATGAPMEEVFNGPPLDHGFVDDATLACLERCSAIHRSDLIHAIMEVEHVRVVRDVRVRVGEKSSQWSLNLDPGSTPRLDYRRSTLGLERAHRPVSLDTHEVVDRFREEQRRAVVRGRLPVAERDLPVPRGRNRNVANYYSIQHQLPATYGVGAAGLAASASPERKARAKQLKAYLTIFDQILANCFAQLARARELLSADGDAEPTYFSQMVADASLGLAEVQRGAPAAHAARLRAITNTVSERSPQRKSRFLSHMMARFAEEFTDHSREGTRPAGAASDRRVVHKKGFLANYPELSGARGVGYDTTDPEPTLCSLEERVRLELGLDLAKDEHVYLVEHILLRPVEEDRPPTDADALRLVPLLSETARVDPYSLQLTFVFPSWPERFTEPHSWKLVGQIVREQTPAHLTPYLRRLDRKAMDAFSSAHGEWRTHRRVYQGGAAETVTSVPTHLALRDARDRLIDLLGIAETYPLRDLSVGSERLTVPFNAVAKIAVKASQVGVTYTLVDQGAALSERINSAAGTGETLDLSTQPMTADVELEIHARRRSTGRSCFLYQRAVVKVGLDEALDAWIHADLLDPSADASGHTAARIGDYGARVEVEIADSQEGVDYRLVQTDGGVSEDPTTDVVLSGDTRGDLGNIVLVSQPLHEDTDIRIRAVKTFEASERRPRETVLLTTVLPMKVRANPDIGVGVADAVVAYGDEAMLRLRRSQQSAAYHVYTRHIRDREFARFAASEHGEIVVSVTGEPDVRVMVPQRGPLWATPAGFEPVGGPVTGSGGSVSVTFGPQSEDTLVLIEARKEHAVAGGRAVSSSIRIAAPGAVLVQPNPAPGLVLSTTGEPGPGGATLQVSGGQPGVFYHFRTAIDGADLDLPAYFHKRDDENPALNKGVNQLADEVDLVVAPSPRLVTGAESTEIVRPEPPLVEVGALEAGTALHVLAVKAQTRVSTVLTQTLQVPAVPGGAPPTA